VGLKSDTKEAVVAEVSAKVSNGVRNYGSVGTQIDNMRASRLHPWNATFVLKRALKACTCEC